MAKDPAIKFSDIFETDVPEGVPPLCPPGFSGANTVRNDYLVSDGNPDDQFSTKNYYYECLKVGVAGRHCFLYVMRVCSCAANSTTHLGG